MIERAIENWLTNTNERNYQTPFCQALLNQGHKIIYVSSHRSMEQGKDVVTIDKNGDCCAYQLKTGNIDLPAWRKIFGEIHELIELPFNHPSVDKNRIHKSYLVLNGKLLDEVRIQIDQINDDNIKKNRKYSYLDVIDFNQLVKLFIDCQGSFMPKELEDFQSFLEIFLSDGAGFLDKLKLFNFFDAILFSKVSRRKSDNLNAIFSSVVINAYILNNFQRLKNYYAVFEAWVILLISILRFSIKTGIGREDIESTSRIIINEIEENLYLLKEEVLQRNDFFEGSDIGDGGIVYKARATIVLGVLSAFEVRKYIISNENYKIDHQFINILKENAKHLFFWGESAFPYYFAVIKYLEIAEDNSLANSLLYEMLGTLVKSDDYKKKVGGIPNFYYGVIDLLENEFEFDIREGKFSFSISDKIDFRQFVGNSYILESLVFMFVKRNMRKDLQLWWKQISHMLFNEFIPEHKEDIFTWRTDFGINHSKFPKQTESWTNLKKELGDIKKGEKILIENEDILTYFILVFPHRINKSIIGYIDF